MPTEVRFDLQIYTLDAVKKALYRLGDKISFTLKLEGNEAVCSIVIRSGAPLGGNLDSMAEQLHLEVLDQDLRERLFEKTAPLRNAILALAFSRTGLQS
ncbi:MAG: His-Xaa-Ser system protein HxsD [Ancalomicrobiaceae bacterium]|nr:His-Xaa-Ser system protein HxsD [Ancalomicrobiaceae bacterium]